MNEGRKEEIKEKERKKERKKEKKKERKKEIWHYFVVINIRLWLYNKIMQC